MEADRVLDCVCSILEERGKVLVAAELVLELAQRGVQVSKQALNEILYAPENRRDGLEHDTNSRWSYSRPTLEKSTPEPAPQVQSILSMFKHLGLTFEGVRRKIGGPLFLVVDETERGYRVIGPKGLLLTEPLEAFGELEEHRREDFSGEQIFAAATLKFKEHSSSTRKYGSALLQSMIHTELHYETVYHGPLCERVLDSIPVSAAIATVFVLAESEIRVGPGITIGPLFLVVEVHDGALGGARYGVFKLCVYDLMKKGWVDVREDEIVLQLRAAQEGVYLHGPNRLLRLE